VLVVILQAPEQRLRDRQTDTGCECEQDAEGSIWDSERGECRKLHNEELPDLCSLPVIILATKSRRVIGVGGSSGMKTMKQKTSKYETTYGRLVPEEGGRGKYA